eukprot:554029-Rhodomonas_salina.1
MDALDALDAMDAMRGECARRRSPRHSLLSPPCDASSQPPALLHLPLGAVRVVVLSRSQEKMKETLRSKAYWMLESWRLKLLRADRVAE